MLLPFLCFSLTRYSISYDKAKLKFQISDPDAYYVHHMSMYEHVLHKAYGFEVAKNKTLIMSRAAFQGECDNLNASLEENFVALIPFYGGLPPNVTKDLSVKSIGQGNSLVSYCPYHASVVNIWL
jgi:hypothetical protein